MRSFNRCLALAITVMATLAAQAPVAQPWDTADSLPGVDLEGLSPQAKKTALRLIRNQNCTCGCGMTSAECRVKDPNCSYSKALTAIVVKGVREGKNPEEIAKDIAASPFGKERTPPPLLDEPVVIPVAGAPEKGPENARITLVEFSDFECPYCARATSQVREVLNAFPKDVRLVYKQFPLSNHSHARLAAMASLAAQQQGKFWEMHDLLFANSRRLGRDDLFGYAKQIGLDIPKFTADLDSPKLKAAVDKDVADGEKANVEGTPSFYLNGKRYNGPFTLDTVKPLIEAELKGNSKKAGNAAR